jgi:hypothetical protein
VPHGRVEIEIVGCAIELLFSDFERIEVFLKSLLGRHAISFWQVGDWESGSNRMRCADMFQATGTVAAARCLTKPSSSCDPSGTGN